MQPADQDIYEVDKEAPGASPPVARPAAPVEAAVKPVPWWKSARSRHPFTRFVLIFLPLCALWFLVKFLFPSPLPPPLPPGQSAVPQAALPTGGIDPLPAPSAWPDDDLKHPDQQPRRDAILAKEQAWLDWYQRPPQCENPTDPQVQVECAKHYVDKGREFEALYRAGELP